MLLKIIGGRVVLQAYLMGCKKRDYFIPKLENMTISKEHLNSFDIEKLPLKVCYFNQGILLSTEQYKGRNRIDYTLRVPNYEVQISLNNLFIDYLTNQIDYTIQDSLYETLEEADLEEFKEELQVSVCASNTS